MISNYQQWLAAGSPWHLAEYISSFAATMRRHGYTVGTIGAVGTHLDIPNPQDHAPFSHTPWPGPQPYPMVCAIDVMPDGPVSLARVGAQIVADKNAGVPGTEWIKYMNWTPDGGSCRNESWKPDHVVSPSGDRGHIHISGRTDYVSTPTSYDPVGRILHTDPTPAPGGGHPTLGNRQLQVGSTGTDVAYLQHQLGVTADGIFGPITDRAVRDFQRVHGLAVDGIVGPHTWAALGVH